VEILAAKVTVQLIEVARLFLLQPGNKVITRVSLSNFHINLISTNIL